MKLRTENTHAGAVTVWCSENKVTGLKFGDFGGKDETPLLKETFSQLNEYFCGKRQIFDIPVSFSGTAFQNKIWGRLLEIPYGKTVTYGELAERAGIPKASRAVGGACNKNPIAIIIPCHRVIGKNGSLTGFAAGTKIKEKLLSLERSQVTGKPMLLTIASQSTPHHRPAAEPLLKEKPFVMHFSKPSP